MERPASVPPLPSPVISRSAAPHGKKDPAAALRQSRSPPPNVNRAPASTAYTPLDSTNRAITAINDFTTALFRLGVRFGLMVLHDRFQLESNTLLSQLYARSQHLLHQQQQAEGMAASFSGNMMNPYGAGPNSSSAYQLSGGYSHLATPPQSVIGLSPAAQPSVLDQRSDVEGWPGMTSMSTEAYAQYPLASPQQISGLGAAGLSPASSVMTPVSMTSMPQQMSQSMTNQMTPGQLQQMRNQPPPSDYEQSDRRWNNLPGGGY